MARFPIPVLWLLALCLALPGLDYAARGKGQMQQGSFYSPALGQSRYVEIYLPAGYDSASVRYPVIYFLHGLGQSEISYSFLGGLLDTLIAAGDLPPVIVVKPNGNAFIFAGSMYTNSALYGAHEDYIARDLVAFMDSTYRTEPLRERRVLMGHSMGGHGALKIAFKHPDRFDIAISLSGFVALEPHDAFLNELLAESGGHPPYVYSPLNGTASLMAFSAAGAFSPNLSNFPAFVDFPLDENGTLIPAIADRWQREMPPRLAAQNPRVRELALYFDCGTNDELGFYPMNVALHDTLLARGIPHRFESFPGGHTDRIEERIRLGLLFASQMLRDSTRAANLPSVRGGTERGK